MGHLYNVDFVEGLFFAERQWGRENSSKLLIEVDADLKDSAKAETLHHEVTEGLNFWQNWELDHHLLTQISTSIFGTMKCNPELVKFLYPESREI